MQALKHSPTQEQLKSQLHYNPDTGEFTRIAMASHLGPSTVGQVVGTKNSAGYLQIRVCGGRYLANRLAWIYMTGTSPNGDVDHIDRNRLNNRWSNLRDVDRSANSRNVRTRPDKSSAFRGVSKRGNRWQVVVRIDGRLKFLGSFDDEQKAGQVAAPYFSGIAP